MFLNCLIKLDKLSLIANLEGSKRHERWLKSATPNKTFLPQIRSLPGLKYILLYYSKLRYFVMEISVIPKAICDAKLLFQNIAYEYPETFFKIQNCTKFY